MNVTRVSVLEELFFGEILSCVHFPILLVSRYGCLASRRFRHSAAYCRDDKRFVLLIGIFCNFAGYHRIYNILLPVCYGVSLVSQIFSILLHSVSNFCNSKKYFIASNMNESLSYFVGQPSFYSFKLYTFFKRGLTL